MQSKWGKWDGYCARFDTVEKFKFILTEKADIFAGKMSSIFVKDRLEMTFLLKLQNLAEETDNFNKTF